MFGYIKTSEPSFTALTLCAAHPGNPSRDVWSTILRFSSESIMNISQDGTDSDDLTFSRLCIGIGAFGDLYNGFAPVKSKG